MLFAISFLAAAALASPIEVQVKTAVLPLRHSAKVTSFKNIVSKGQSRLLKVNGQVSGPGSDASSGSVTNEDVTYVAPVSIGGRTFELIVDTGCEFILCHTLRLLTR